MRKSLLHMTGFVGWILTRLCGGAQKICNMSCSEMSSNSMLLYNQQCVSSEGIFFEMNLPKGLEIPNMNTLSDFGFPRKGFDIQPCI